MSLFASGFSYTLGKLGLWLLIPFLLGFFLGWLLWRCLRGARGASVSSTTTTDLATSRTLVSKHEARIGELQATHAKDSDLITSLRGKVSALESAPPRVVEKLVDRPVEKLVDNPAHMSRISALEAEVAGVALLRSKLSAAESAPPRVVEKLVTVEKIVDRPTIVEKIVDRPTIVEKIVDRPTIVERLVDNPAHLSRIAILEAEAAKVAGLQTQIHSLTSAPPKIVEKIVTVEKIVDRPVEKIVTVEKAFDNPVLLARIAELETEAGTIAGLQSQIHTLSSAPPKVVERTVTVERIVEKSIDNPAHLARIRELEGELVRARALAMPVFDGAQAKLALGVAVKLDDLKVVEGIGPKIEELLHNDGIVTWRQLSQTDPARIRVILDAAGPAYRIAEPATWPQQAGLAADGKWSELKVLMDNLDGGRPA